MIYLASPYTHDLAAVRQRRYETVCTAAARLMHDGHAVFSPIAHTHGICLASGGVNFEYSFWKKYDEEMIRLCDQFWILRMEGWEQSEGIKMELAYAMSIGRDPFYV